jgi:glycosyltransferase involved in cell wall biosynthesis
MDAVNLLHCADTRFPIERANGIQIMETCHALAVRGHQVTLLVRRDRRHANRDPFNYYGLPPLPALRIRRPTLPRSGFTRRLGYLSHALRWALGPARPDLVITRDLGVADLLLRLPVGFRPPIVYESHGLAPIVASERQDVLSNVAGASRGKQLRLFTRERRVWSRAEGYVTITRGIASDLAARFGGRSRLLVASSGVRLMPVRRFAPPSPRETPVLAYAGHLYPGKGVEILLRAVALLPRVRAVIIGGYPNEADLAKMRGLTRELRLDDRVEFTGQVEPSKVSPLLAAADLLILPVTGARSFKQYTSPMKLFEYMALGKPIVASDLPAIGEVLRDGENAVLVEPDSPERLAGGVRRVLDDRVLAERIAHGAFDGAAQYSWEQRAERLERLFREVLGDLPSNSDRSTRVS